MKDISVIVPVYNVENYLRKCLDSLVGQTFKGEYEIIIVNDGSPDNSQKIIDEYVSMYPNKIKAFIKENGGLSSARNYGIKKASGKYLSFVDSDDYVTPDFLEILYNKIIEDDYDICVCDIYEKSEVMEKILLGRKDFTDNIIKDIMVSLPAACNKLYKKELFINNDIYYPDRIYYEDLATTPRLLTAVKKIVYVNKPLYYYMVRSNSITHQQKYNPKTADIFISTNIIYDYFKEKNIYNKYVDEIEYIYIYHLIHSYIMGIYNYSECKDCIKNVHNTIKERFPKWKKNKYFKMENIKYKIICNLIYSKRLYILRLILNRNK